ncbi:MAG TPA: general secretion pathway protein GspE, partial [Epsilonproteobacteria bacterium]|nr:general secretion pathway protein GspE [Campylobacterota bacterium]
MVRVIEMMLQENLVSKDAIASLIRSRPPKKVSLSNLIAENIIKEEVVRDFLVKKIRQGDIAIEHLEKIEGMDIVPVIQEVAKQLDAKFFDLDETEIDMLLFSKVPYKQLIKYNAIPIEESDLNITVVFS